MNPALSSSSSGVMYKAVAMISRIFSRITASEKAGVLETRALVVEWVQVC